MGRIIEWLKEKIEEDNSLKGIFITIGIFFLIGTPIALILLYFFAEVI